MASPNGAGNNFLDGSAATSASDVWSVGNWTSGSGSTAVDRTLIEHWNGNSWSIVPTGNVGNYSNDVNGVVAISPNNAWAIGEYIDHFVAGSPPVTYDINQTLIMHWNGATWTIMPSVDNIPPGFSESDNLLLGIAAFGPSNIYAVGTYYTGVADQTLILHYDGSSWGLVTSVNASAGDNFLFGISGTSASDIWATGFYRATGSGDPPSGNGSARQTLTEHWNGVVWTVVASPSVNVAADSNLFQVNALAANNVWAVGYGRSSTGTGMGVRQTLIEQYNGTTWSIVTSPDGGVGDNVLLGLSMQSASSGWAVGYQTAAAGNTSPPQTLAERWDGTSWTTVSTPDSSSTVDNELFAVTGLSSSDVWALGFAQNINLVYQTLTANFCTPPTVTSVTPNKGPTSGGTSVTINGTGFVLATPAPGVTAGVMFGSLAANGYTVNSDTQITATTPAETVGTVDTKVNYFAGSSATSSADQFSFVPLYVFSPQPIAPGGSLSANATVNVTVTAKSFDGTGVSGATVYLDFVQSGGSETAKVGSTLLNATFQPFVADSNGTVTITFDTGATPGTIGTDTITAQDAASSPTVTNQDTYTYSKLTTFYFAEGFTGTGFSETLSLLMPTQSGTATIDYYTDAGHQPQVSVPLTAGVVHVENVNTDVGANHPVSALVTFPAQGVAERQLYFNNGSWKGSNDNVGVPAPSTEWDFAEGSTLNIFNEFLSLQNPNPYPVIADLNYATDIGQHPTRSVFLPANSRTTVEVYQGNLAANPPPPLNYGGCDPLHNCGVGSGVVGVSVQVKSRTLPIVAERPFYVNNYSFGYGAIKDGHDAFGANAPAKTWNFAEGNTINGFNEYLTIQNPGLTAANVNLHYIDDIGTKDVAMVVAPQSRQTALVFDPAHFGIGRQYVGVSVVITSDQPIVAERPMYIYYNFGTGPVAGAHVVVGSSNTGKLFGFAYASTLAGDNDYLTIQNANATVANVTITYYKTDGTTVTKVVPVAASSRHTVLIFGTTEGVGTGVAPVGIVVSSDQLVLVEKPTYSSNGSTYGATDTQGYTPPTGSF